MTTDQRTPELTAMEAAQLDAFEAAAYAEEALRERVAAALFATKQERDGDFYVVAWGDNYARDEWYALADAALAVVRTPVEAER